MDYLSFNLHKNIQEFQETMEAYNYICMHNAKTGPLETVNYFDESKIKSSLQILEKNMYEKTLQ